MSVRKQVLLTGIAHRLQTSDDEDVLTSGPLDRNTALVIIDVQNAMDAPKWADRNNAGLVPNLLRVLERWRKLGWPVYMVADDDANPDSPYHPGQSGNGFKVELAPVEGERVVRKTTGSAFVGTDFESQLRRAGHHTLVVGGFQTNMCVAAAVRGARDLGFTVYVLADGTATVGLTDRRGRWWDAEDVHNLALANLQSATTHVIDIDDLMSRLPWTALRPTPPCVR